MAPSCSNEGFRPASASTVVRGLMNSSSSRMVWPRKSCTGTTEPLKWPAARAAAARCCEVTAKASTSARPKPSSVAIRSAPMPCGTKPVARLVAGSCAQAPPSLPMGTRLMLSTPPATTRSSQPERTFCAARLTASSPEAQKRLTCMPAQRQSQPALRAATLGSTEPCSPMGETMPITTSSTAAVSRSWRVRSACSVPASRSMGLTSCRLPSFLPLPRGVRMASNTNASVIGVTP